MSQFEFDAGDLYGLEVCLRDLDEMLVREEEAKTDKAVRYALIKSFELTYEIAVKTMRKYLVLNSAKGDVAQDFDFQDLVRLADQHGLIATGWPGWKRYRNDRSRTVHTYGGAVALEIGASLHDFSAEIHTLFDNLKKRAEEEHG